MDFTLGITKYRAVLLVAQMMLTPTLTVSAHTRVLELTMDSDLLALGTHDPSGQLHCRANGNSYTIERVSMTQVKANGESTELLAITLGEPETNYSSSGVLGIGTLKDNMANINLDVLESSVCDSSYFICGVAFKTESGESQKAFTSTGHGLTPNFYPGLSVSKHPVDIPAGSQASELRLLKEQLQKIEAQSESLSDRLDRRMSLVYDTIRSIDTSSRVSRLEDKLLPFLLSQASDDSNTNIMQTLTSLRAKLEEVNASVTTLQEFELQDKQPEICVRGMGDDVTKRYPPYAIMNLDMLQRQILCETQMNGGGWIVIQRRAKGDVDFYRDWTSYRDGFGSPTGDFWIGNEAIHQLTNSAAFELRVDIRFKGQDLFAEYGHFRIEDETSKYRLQVSQYTGTAGDAMAYSNNHYFSTFEADSDVHGSNCAVDFHGAWWYKSCANANLNGRWGAPANEGNYWVWKATKDPVSFSEMKIRRVK